MQLDQNHRCNLFDDPSRPEICSRFAANAETCGTDRAEALRNLFELEIMTGDY